ncbi:MAG: hypothetical protein MJZ23_10435 [Paludibacteraceae bacterium]|nr:hypothetical protein [Paludibacteraceae bacterium]
MDFETTNLAIKNKTKEIVSLLDEIKAKLEAEEYEEAGELYLKLQRKSAIMNSLVFDLAQYVL